MLIRILYSLMKDAKGGTPVITSTPSISIRAFIGITFIRFLTFSILFVPYTFRILPETKNNKVFPKAWIIE